MLVKSLGFKNIFSFSVPCWNNLLQSNSSLIMYFYVILKMNFCFMSFHFGEALLTNHTIS